jgi:hypothetical protein
MAKTLLEKMFLKPEYSVALLHMPKDLQVDFKTGNKTDNALQTTNDFILAFYTRKEDMKKDAKELKESLKKNGLLWIAYPKAKALETDLNRDILHETAKQFGLDGVSLISLNQTWSAMRFKIK